MLAVVLSIALLALASVPLLRLRQARRAAAGELADVTTRLHITDAWSFPVAGTVGGMPQGETGIPGKLMLYTSRGADYLDVLAVSDGDGIVRFNRGYRPQEPPDGNEWYDRWMAGVPLAPRVH